LWIQRDGLLLIALLAAIALHPSRAGAVRAADSHGMGQQGQSIPSTQASPTDSGPDEEADAPNSVDTVPPPAPVNVTGRPANELGRVLIMEYHRIANPEGPWQRAPSGFRRDLQRLYDAGFRSVPLSDVLANHIDLPLGTSPVVFTFDDSYSSQLWWSADGTPAPDSAVGILEQFAAQHPDFGMHGVFYVTWNQLFGGPATAGVEKLRYLVQHGFELGNHSMSHANFGAVSSAAVQQELAQEQALVRQSLDGYEMQTMALPFGAWPRDKSLAVSGASGASKYRFAAVLQVGSEPAPSPASSAFNAIVLPRVQAGEALLSYWLNWFDTHRDERYVSDGDPSAISFPSRLASRIRKDAGQYWQVIGY
jgi:peptidoglycan/xylan/chitin deacetylase (PgdA/CDA1 family)